MPLTAHQVAAREHALGMSEIAAVLGLNPYRGPFDVWARFHLPAESQELHEDDPGRPEFRAWGDILEEPIAQEYARRERVEIRRLADDESWQHSKLPFLVGHPDRLLVGRRKGLEVKTANIRVAHRWGSPEEEILPDEYRLQCAGYMALGEYECWDLAVLIGGSDFRIYRLRRDLELELDMLAGLEVFWKENIIGGVRPPVASSPQAEEWLRRLFPRNRRPLIDATPALVDLAREYAAARDSAKEAEAHKEHLGNQLREAIGDAEGFRWGLKGRFKATWTTNKDGVTTDYEAIVAELRVPEELVQKHTRTKPGARVLRVAVEE